VRVSEVASYSAPSKPVAFQEACGQCLTFAALKARTRASALLPPNVACVPNCFVSIRVFSSSVFIRVHPW
jgi:hypothetical protein